MQNFSGVSKELDSMPDFKAMTTKEKQDTIKWAEETPYFFWIRHSLLWGCTPQHFDDTFEALDFTVGLTTIDDHIKLLILFMLLEIAFNVITQISFAMKRFKKKEIIPPNYWFWKFLVSAFGIYLIVAHVGLSVSAANRFKM